MAWVRVEAKREERLTLMTFMGRGKNRQTCHKSPPGHINHPHKTSYVSPASSLPTCVPSQLTCFLLPSALPLPLLTPILCSITCTRCSKVGASSVSPRSRGCCWGQRYLSGERAHCPHCSCRAFTPCHQASPCQVWHPTLSPPPQQVAVSWSRPCFPECTEADSCG